MLDIRSLYAAVERRMEQIDFETLWHGFHRYEFALYTEDTVYLRDRELPWDERFLANTTIEFEGGQLAIWNIGAMEQAMSGEEDISNTENSLKNELDVDILTAGMVHEMFHAFQVESGETRFSDDLAALDYPMETENFRIKYVENKILAQALDAADQREQRDLLREFVTLRAARQESFGTKISYEGGAETIEGMAEYVGTSALTMLSMEKYRMRVMSYQSKLRDLSQDMFDVRNQSYYVGTRLLLAAREAEVSMAHEVGAEERYVWEILKNELDRKDDPMAQVLCARRQKQEIIIRNFMEKTHTEVTGNFEVCGYDPVNMFKVGNLIYESNFFALRGVGEGKFGDSPMKRQQDGVIKLFGEVVLETNETGRVKRYYI